MNTFFTRISITGIAAAGLGVAMLFGAGSASAATPEEPGFAALPCLTDFCPTIPDPDPDPDPKPLFPAGDLSVCIQHDENGQPDCDEDVDPDPAVDAADDLQICTPWLHSLGICGNDDDGPVSPTDDLAPAPHCVQIHKDFPCPTDDDDDDSDTGEVPEILPFDGECTFILVKLGEIPPIDPDCEDGFCVLQLLEEGEVPEFVDPDCFDDGSGDEDVPDGDQPTDEPEDVPQDQPQDGPQDEPQDQPQDEPGDDTVDEQPQSEPEDQPQDQPSDTPAGEPSDGPSDQPQAGDTPDHVVPEAPDAGTGNAVAGMSPNSIYAALALAIAGGILGGAALSLGRKS